MEVLEAHQQRTARLRETLDRLIGLHSRMFELRSQSWLEHIGGDRDRVAVRDDLHRQIDEIEAETKLLRGEFTHVPEASG